MIPTMASRVIPNIIILGKGVDKVTSFSQFVSGDEFVYVLFSLEVADSGVVSLNVL